MKTYRYSYKPKKAGYKVWVTKNKSSKNSYKRHSSTPIGIDIICMLAKGLFK